MVYPLQFLQLKCFQTFSLNIVFFTVLETAEINILGSFDQHCIKQQTSSINGKCHLIGKV